ncbi:MAG: polysaccharide biosynthesis/export family protein [Chitinophagales bacterium]|nr:polysaccharide biosynthesis/export family protein [Chitinophagales bacterium]
MKRNFLFLFFLIFLASCKVYYPDRLFKIDEEKLTQADTMRTPKEYVIRNGDILSVGVFSNNGYELVDVITKDNNAFSALKYVVKESGYIFLPMLDSVYVYGLTIGQVEKLLSEKYTYYFVNPFIRVEVTNRNVYVFLGRGSAKTITLTRENTNLLQILSDAEGIPRSGKAYKIRVLRGDLKNPSVFNIDLSTIEGMQKANLTMIANDVVYIESRITSGDVVYQVLPILSFISTLLLLYTTIYTISK